MLSEMEKLISDDGYAASFQSMGQYRTALLAALRAQADALPVAWRVRYAEDQPWVYVDQGESFTGLGWHVEPVYLHPAPEAAQADAQPICKRIASGTAADWWWYELGVPVGTELFTHPAPEAAQALSDAKARIAELEAAVKDWKSKAEYRALNDALTSSAATVAEPSILHAPGEWWDEAASLHAEWTSETMPVAGTELGKRTAAFIADCIARAQAAQQQAEPVGDLAKLLWDAAKAIQWHLEPKSPDEHEVLMKRLYAESAAQSGQRFAVPPGYALVAIEPVAEILPVVAQSCQRAGVAQGWKLVPDEPTPAMLEQIKFLDEITDTAMAARYRAMLAAAPTPAAQGGVEWFTAADISAIKTLFNACSRSVLCMHGSGLDTAMLRVERIIWPDSAASTQQKERSDGGEA